MYKQTFFPFRKIIATGTLLIACIAAPHGHAAAQEAFSDSGLVIPVDGPRKGTRITIDSYDKLLAHPMLVTSTGQRIVKFTMSFQPKGKDYRGPFETTGSKFTRQQRDIIEQCRDEQIATTKIFIEEATVYEGGKPKILGSFIITVTPANK